MIDTFSKAVHSLLVSTKLLVYVVYLGFYVLNMYCVCYTYRNALEPWGGRMLTYLSEEAPSPRCVLSVIVV